jgi:hypothetical protein
VSTFFVSDNNPNDGIGGGGCVCHPTKCLDCKGPYAIFPATETDNNSSPHVVLSLGCAKAEKLKKAAVQARQPFERESWLNLAFYLDEQYVEWHKDSNSIRRIPRDRRAPNTPRPVVNKIMHFVQQERAMVLQAKPTVDILPATDDLLDITDAAVGKAYCTYVAEPVNANFLKQLSRASLWAIIGGEGYLKWVWNAAAKRPDVIPCSIFEIAFDPYATDFQKARYVIHSKFMDVEQVLRHLRRRDQGDRRRDRRPDAHRAAARHGFAPAVNGVTVNELWYKPCKRYPEGLYVVWAGRTSSSPRPAALRPQAPARSRRSAASSGPTRRTTCRRSSTCARRRCSSTSTTRSAS